MTNIIATIQVVTALVTNISTNNEPSYNYRQAPCPDGMIGCLVYHAERCAPFDNPAVKLISTEVWREERVSTKFGGFTNRTKLTNWVMETHATVEIETNWSKPKLRVEPSWNELTNYATTNWATNIHSWIVTNIMRTNWIERTNR